jgi:hypothetical protein
MEKIYIYPIGDCGDKSPINTKFAFVNPNMTKDATTFNTITDINNLNDYATNFGRTEDGLFYSWDPRLYSSSRAQHTLLDTPPHTGKTELKNVYNEKLRGYGQNLTNYASIKDGSITYYVGDERKDAPFRPIFSSSASVETGFYKDPMDAKVPEYVRGFPEWKNQAVKRDDTHCGLTSVSDTNWRRESYLSYYESSLQQKPFVRR